MYRSPMLSKDLHRALINDHLQKLIIIVGLLFFLLVSLQAPAQITDQVVHHKLDIQLLPTLKMIKGQDTLTFPAGSPRKMSFVLHKNLKVTVQGHDDSIMTLHSASKLEQYTEYGLTLGSQDSQVTLTYSGVIYDPIKDNSSGGLISSEGATLFENTYWYPSILDTQKNFEISIRAPAEWTSLTQGQLVSHEKDGSTAVTQFKEIYPQEDLYLVAGPFKSTEAETSTGKKLRILLREDNPSLAQNYLSVLPGYIEHYSEIIAPYPYEGFSVIENLWETGYGMPSFTLLGPSVIRLPFILTSSLPHEVLHNWWGNSVYVDYEKGNWSEGLTTYMADYWQQEILQQDRTYRMKALMNFADFVSANPALDFPVRQFKDRHNASSQAVGYSKSMMIFHLLEFRFGKELFNKALQNFYNENLYQKASFNDLQASFEKATSTKLGAFFNQWLDRSGAPWIELTDVKNTQKADGTFQTTYVLSQKQLGLYELAIPVILTLDSGQILHQLAKLNEKTQSFNLVAASPLKNISVDPDFHLFRQLYNEERPITLSSILGNPSLHFFFNGNKGDSLQFIQAWVDVLDGKNHLHNVNDNFDLPSEGAIILVGNNETFADFMRYQLADQNFQLSENEMSINGTSFNLNEVSSVLVSRLRNHPNQSVVWVRWNQETPPAEWAKRLTHYGSSGVLIFKGRPTVLQTTWPVTDSPLQRKM